MAIPKIPQQPEPIRKHLCSPLNTLCGRTAWQRKGMMKINMILGVWAWQGSKGERKYFTEQYEERPNTPNSLLPSSPPFLPLLSRSSFMINVLRLNEWLMMGGWLWLLYQPMTVRHWSLSDKIHCSVFYHFNLPVNCKRILNICSCINSCWAFLNVSSLSVSVNLSLTHTYSLTDEWSDIQL